MAAGRIPLQLAAAGQAGQVPGAILIAAATGQVPQILLDMVKSGKLSIPAFVKIIADSQVNEKSNYTEWKKMAKMVNVA